MKYTLDSNCIIDLEEGREDAIYLRELVRRHRAKEIEIAVVAISASENQKGGAPSEDYEQFERKLIAAGLEGVVELYPMMYWDVSYWDRAIWCDAEGAEELEQRIHDILFPGTPIAEPEKNNFPIKKWINQKCDVQIAWAHIYHGQDILITRDENFHNNAEALRATGISRIAKPSDAPH